MKTAKIKYQKYEGIISDGTWATNGRYLVRVEALRLTGAPKIQALLETGATFARDWGRSGGGVDLNGDDVTMPNVDGVIPKHVGAPLHKTGLWFEDKDGDRFVLLQQKGGTLTAVAEAYAPLLGVADLYQKSGDGGCPVEIRAGSDLRGLVMPCELDNIPAKIAYVAKAAASTETVTA